jgi:hypothetical protein
MLEQTLQLKIETTKKSFFDRESVHRAVDAACRRVLSRAGAFVRTRAQSLMLRHIVRRGFGVKSMVTDRKGVAPAGDPPYVHTGLLVKFIFFSYEAQNKSVVIGPTRLNSKPEPVPIPALLEYGGTAGRKRFSDAYAMMFKKSNPVKLCFYRARPYMRPALKLEAPNFPGLFRGQVRPVGKVA